MSAFLDSKRSLSTQYGAIVCLAKLGPKVVDLFLIENAATYMEHLAARPDTTPRETSAKARVKRVYVEAVGKFIQSEQAVTLNGPLPAADATKRMEMLREVFGEEIVPYFN